MSSSSLLLLSILAAALPVTLYIGLIYWADRYEKEPWWLLLATFFWGAVPSILFAYIFNSIFSLPLYLVAGDALGESLSATFVAPIVEETIKGLAVVGILLLWRDEIDSPLDGIIYGAMVGLGFALVENVYYFINVYQEGGIDAWGINVFIRSIVFGLNHALFTSMIGLGIALARSFTQPLAKVAAVMGGWATAMFLHFLHNLSVSFGNLLCLVALFSDWAGLLLTLLIIVWALLQERQWLRHYLAEEVSLGYLTSSQYVIVCSGRQRVRYQWGVLLGHGPAAYWRTVRSHHRLSELAYKKHHYKRFQDERSRELIDSLRAEIQAQGQV
ncbi:MAG: PrsW family intramembrane metalloprotease [Ardenticatenaceae bacterium]|nr:PrsW family intramembrane metalloprotease [Ardenticatenaceae bacterium]MCB8986242.1 PrsW family intramembrane metalloprotease [Ardenticatenaceae bacterium]